MHEHIGVATNRRSKECMTRGMALWDNVVVGNGHLKPRWEVRRAGIHTQHHACDSSSLTRGSRFSVPQELKATFTRKHSFTITNVREVCIERSGKTVVLELTNFKSSSAEVPIKNKPKKKYCLFSRCHRHNSVILYTTNLVALSE